MLSHKVHDLKVIADFFPPLLSGEQTFELRQDDGFHAGDILVLREWDVRQKVYTGRKITKRITYLLSGVGLAPNYVCMALADDARS